MFKALLILSVNFSCFVWAEQPQIEAGRIKATVASFVGDFIGRQGKAASFYPKEWKAHLHTQGLDVNDLLNLGLDSGRAYGAVASQKIDFSLELIRKRISGPKNLFRSIAAVKTLTDVAETKCPHPASEPSFCLTTAIDVPILPDFHTDAQVILKENSDKRVVIEWKQFDDVGDLTYNQGATIAEPDGGLTKITVIGIHIIKQENKVPWIGRATARAFAETHYGNFIRGLTAFLGTPVGL